MNKVARLLMLICASVALYGCTSGKRSPDPKPPVQPVTAREFFPARVFITPVGKGYIVKLMTIKETEVVFEEFAQGTNRTLGTIPSDPKRLSEVLNGIDRNDLLGHARYAHPSMRDGGEVRLLTPLGDITLYEIFDTSGRPMEGIELPSHVARLGPLVAYAYDCWKQLK